MRNIQKLQEGCLFDISQPDDALIIFKRFNFTVLARKIFRYFSFTGWSWVIMYTDLSKHPQW